MTHALPPDPTLEVLPGRGTVGRRGGVVMWLGEGGPSRLAAAVCDLLDESSPLDALTALLESEPDAGELTVAVVMADGADVHGVLQGGVIVQNAGGQAYTGPLTGGPLRFRLTGDTALAVRGSVTALAIGDVVGHDHVVAGGGLRDGMVPGGGLLLRRSPTDAEAGDQPPTGADTPAGAHPPAGAGAEPPASASASAYASAPASASASASAPASAPAPASASAPASAPGPAAASADALHPDAAVLPDATPRPDVLPGAVLPAAEQPEAADSAEGPPEVVIFDLSVAVPPRPPLPVSRKAGAGEAERAPERAADGGAGGADAGPPARGMGEALTEEPVAPNPEVAPAPSSADGPPAEDEARPALPLVRGIMCANRHFNHLDANYCRVCGIGMVQASKLTVLGERPSVGVLVMPDGTTFSLDGDYVIGRHPSDEHRAIVVDDKRVSRNHARVSLRDWEVVVEDLNSSNGTYIRNKATPQWVRVAPGDPAVLDNGGELGVGSAVIVYESVLRRPV